MFKTLNTLFLGASGRADEKLKDHFAIELIDQKVREAEQQLKTAKGQLAMLMQRERSEGRMKVELEKRLDDLMNRARAAIDGGRDDLATEAAEAVAHMENELTMRRETHARLEGQVFRLKQSVEAAHRRIVDLKQGATMARSLKREHDMQLRLQGSASSESAVQEAEELIARVLRRDDPAEQAEIMREINDDLSGANLPDRMAAAGFGPATKSTAADVLARLKSEPNDTSN